MDDLNHGAEKTPSQNPAPGLPGQGPAPVPEKSKGGRPLGSKDKAPRRRPGERAGLRPPPGAGQQLPAAPGGSTAPAASSQPAGDPVSNLWDAENCRAIAELPFHAAAVITNWDGAALNDREADKISLPLARVLNRYFPAGSEYSDMTALCATLLVVAGVKRHDYNKYLKSQESKKP